MARWLDRLKVDPTEWLLEKSCAPIQYRFLTEVLDKPADDPAVAHARNGSMNYKSAVTISRAQQETGTWLDKVLEFEAPNNSRHRGPGTVNQFLSLVEWGWDPTHPIIHASAQRLDRYLVADPSVDLYELKGYAGNNPVANSVIRRELSVISAALLARAGYLDNENLTTVVERVLRELTAQYPKDGGVDLYAGTVDIEEDRTYRIVRDGRHIPDMFLFYLLAFHPRFRADASVRDLLGRVTDHLMKGDDIPDRMREADGKRFIKLVDLPIGHWTQERFAEKRLGTLLHDLELLARCGTLPRAPKALDLLSWLLSLQDEDGVFRVDDHIEKVISRSQYHYFPLEESWRGKHKKYTDVTFRVMLILRRLDETCPDAA